MPCYRLSASGRYASCRKPPADAVARVPAGDLQDKSPQPPGVRQGAFYSFSAFVRYGATDLYRFLSHDATVRSRHATHPVKGMRGILLFFHLMFIYYIFIANEDGNRFSVYLQRSPERRIPRGLFLSVVALHRDRTEELYFITLVLISTACSPVAG